MKIPEKQRNRENASAAHAKSLNGESKEDDQEKGLLEQAFDNLIDPNNYNMFGAIKFPISASRYFYD